MAGPSYQPLSQLPTGGYDDDNFVDPVPESLHCPVCLLVLREPHLISCCGTHICQVTILIVSLTTIFTHILFQVCIQRIQANEQCCPCCRSEYYINVLNKEKRGKVCDLRVRCVNSAKGCKWVGGFGDQDRHCTSRCQYVEAMCQYGCGESYPRFMIGKHEQDECPERPIDMKMATFTRQMMEKVSSLETRYEGEIAALKQKLEDQEERHIMEKKELQHEIEVQTEEMKKKAETDKEQIQVIKKKQEKCEAETRELANKLDLQDQKITEKDKKEVELQLPVHNNYKYMRKKLIAVQHCEKRRLENEKQRIKISHIQGIISTIVSYTRMLWNYMSAP